MELEAIPYRRADHCCSISANTLLTAGTASLAATTIALIKPLWSKSYVASAACASDNPECPSLDVRYEWNTYVYALSIGAVAVAGLRATLDAYRWYRARDTRIKPNKKLVVQEGGVEKSILAAQIRRDDSPGMKAMTGVLGGILLICMGGTAYKVLPVMFPLSDCVAQQGFSEDVCYQFRAVLLPLVIGGALKIALDMYRIGVCRNSLMVSYAEEEDLFEPRPLHGAKLPVGLVYMRMADDKPTS